MAIIHYDKKAYAVEGADSVLDTLLKHEVDFPHSCKIGTCQSCLTKSLDGAIPSAAQTGLKPTLAAKNYFLACQCKPDGDMTIALPDEGDAAISSSIISLSMFSHNVLCVRLAIDKPELFKAGQYINLVTPDNIIRSYSIANVPEDYLELHVKLLPNGLMGHWLTQEAKVGSVVYIRGPMGDCFYYNPERESFPIVLAGTGTGLAPLIGIAADALENGHKGEIILIHGGVSRVDLYLHAELSALQKANANFTYVPCLLNGSDSIQQASIDNVLVEKLEGIAGAARLFICGPEDTTKKMKLKAFLAGVPSASIYSDAFISAGL